MLSQTGNPFPFLSMKILQLSLAFTFLIYASHAAKPKRLTDADLPWPPTLPDGKKVVTDKSPEFLKGTDTLREGVVIAKEAPTIDFLFYPEQDYPGKPWSNWGDGCLANGKYYSGIGDHYAIGRGENKYGNGEALAYEYDPKTKNFRALVKVSKFLDLPNDHYAPGKIHSRIDMGSDGWLYYATHRGSSRATVDANHYKGDWIFCTNPKSGKTEVVATAPIPKHCIPNSVLDPERMIFYGGTAPGSNAENQEIQFFAYDIKKRKLLYRCDNGPARYIILAQSTGKLYYVPGAHGGGAKDGSPVVQYDLKTRTRKVLAFLHPFYESKYGFIPKGTYSTEISEEGDKLFITWNTSRGVRAWDCCGLTVVHIPKSERMP